MKRFAIVPFLALSALLQGAEVPPPTFANVPYDVHKRTTLDFWQAEGEGPRPLRVFIHGGGWTWGDKSRVDGVESYLKKGISVASINYRFSITHPLPTPVHDAVRALQFLRHKATEWNIDKTRVVLTGTSAGGCTSLLIACMDDVADLTSEDPVKRESSRVQGVAVKAAQTSIDPKFIEPWIGPNVWHRMIHHAVGEPSIEAAKENYANHEALYRKFSPDTHLSTDDPPIYLAYSDDLTVPAKSISHGIHHGVFGIKFKEKAAEVGHEDVHLALGKNTDSPYRNADDFVESILLAK
jgi:acetyl esterase/lipase